MFVGAWAQCHIAIEGLWMYSSIVSGVGVGVGVSVGVSVGVGVGVGASRHVYCSARLV